MAVKIELKKWNKLRGRGKPITQIQAEFESIFYQIDQDPEYTALYDTIYQMGQRLNDQTQQHTEFLRQQRKVLWLQQGA